MPDQFTETTTKGWFSRIGSAFGGVIGGIVLIFVCIGLLGWNENRAVRTERALNEGAGLVVSVNADTVDPQNDDALIHVSGDTSTASPIIDSQFGVQADGLRLSRVVEMLQWEENSRSETRTKLGGGEETVTHYTYAQTWSRHPIESGSFRIPNGHQNPEFPFESADFNASNAHLGAFSIGDPIINQVGGQQPLMLDDTAQETARQAAGRDATVSRTTIFIGDDPDTPDVGDLRVSYEVTPAEVISVVGAQSGDGIESYRTRNGEQVLLVADGEESADAMFSSAQDGNRMLLWAIRIGGLIGLVTGFGLLLNPLKVLADVIPLLGTIVGMGTGLIAAVLGVTVGTIVIAVAWFAVRPLTSLIILLIGGGVAFVFFRFGRKRLKKTRAAEAAAAPAG